MSSYRSRELIFARATATISGRTLEIAANEGLVHAPIGARGALVNDEIAQLATFIKLHTEFTKLRLIGPLETIESFELIQWDDAPGRSEGASPVDAASTTVPLSPAYGRKTAFCHIADALERAPHYTSLTAHRIVSEPTRYELIDYVIRAVPHLRHLEWMGYWEVGDGQPSLSPSWSIQRLIEGITHHSAMRDLDLMPAPCLSDTLLSQLVVHNTVLTSLCLRAALRSYIDDRSFNIDVNWSLLRFRYPLLCSECHGLHYETATCRVARVLDRNWRESWQLQRHRMIDYCLALAPLGLSPFVLLELVSWTIERPGPDPCRLRRLRLIESIMHDYDEMCA